MVGRQKNRIKENAKSRKFSPSGGPSGKGGQKRENPTRSGNITCMEYHSSYSCLAYNAAYLHEDRADKGRYRHDRRAGRRCYQHDHHADSLSRFQRELWKGRF